MTEQQLLPVVQADREEAAKLYEGEWTAPSSAGFIRNGVWDHHHAVQAFARHRHTFAQPADAVSRISREQYPEIVQAARWMDDDDGTPHFEPGIGFVVDDPAGLLVPNRWLPHLAAIETALAGLDHQQPHPDDIDTITYLSQEGKEPTLFESAAYCFVCGEHTPVTIMANTSRDLWIANRFFNERFEGWEFDPAAGCPLTPGTAAGTVEVGK